MQKLSNVSYQDFNFYSKNFRGCYVRSLYFFYIRICLSKTKERKKGRKKEKKKERNDGSNEKMNPAKFWKARNPKRASRTTLL